MSLNHSSKMSLAFGSGIMLALLTHLILSFQSGDSTIQRKDATIRPSMPRNVVKLLTSKTHHLSVL
jgi:hypothetical protein